MISCVLMCCFFGFYFFVSHCHFFFFPPSQRSLLQNIPNWLMAFLAQLSRQCPAWTSQHQSIVFPSDLMRMSSMCILFRDIRWCLICNTIHALKRRWDARRPECTREEIQRAENMDKGKAKKEIRHLLIMSCVTRMCLLKTYKSVRMALKARIPRDFPQQRRWETDCLLCKMDKLLEEGGSTSVVVAARVNFSSMMS